MRSQKQRETELKEKHAKYVKNTGRSDKPLQDTSSTRTDTTAYTTALTTGSSRTTKNECIFVRIVKVWRKMRQNYFLC